MLRALAGRYSVEVLAVRRGDQAYVEQLRATRTLRVPVPDGPLRDQIETYRRALRRQLEGAGYDCVHFCDGVAAVPVMRLKQQLGYVTVFDAGRAGLSSVDAGDEALARELLRDELACLRSADLVLAPTEPAARFLIAKGGGDRVRLVPPGVDVDTFDWDHPSHDGPARIFYSGPIGPGRGIPVLLRAMREVAARTDVRLVFAGPVAPPFMAELQRMIAEYALVDRVDFIGAIDNEAMPRAIADAAICVAPTAPELARNPLALYPTRLLEYMACRRVLVAPRRGTVAMLVADGEQGLLFTPDDATDLAAQILRLLADRGLCERLARAAYERVRHAHTASATRRALALAYRAIAAHLPEEDTSTNLRIAPALDDRGTDSLLDAARVASGQIGSTGTSGVARVDTDSAVYAPPTVITEAPTGDDFTRPDLKAASELPRAESDSGEAPQLGEPWVVARGALGRRRGAAVEDDEGTPVEVRRVETDSSPIENRFVAGEVEVDEADDAAADPVPPFTAVSVLLPGGGDPGDDADEDDDARAED